MTATALLDGLRSVAIGALTPYDEDLEVAYGKLRENVTALHEAGIGTFLACANVSEFHSLSGRERVQVTDACVAALPSDACVVAGVGGSTKTALSLIDEVERVGVDGIMVMPPQHTFKHQRGLVTYYRKLGERADTGLVPYVRGFDPTAETLAAIADLDAVAGIKYALEDVPKFARARALSDDDEVVWVNGLAEPWALSFYLEGAEGFTAGVGNFVPRLSLALLEALRAGEWERAREIRNVSLPYQTLRGESGTDNPFPGANSVPALKYGLELAGLHGGPVREPIVDLSAEDRTRAEEMYARIRSYVDENLESA